VDAPVPEAPLAPDDLRRMQVVSAGMLAGTLLFLGVMVFLHLTSPRGPGVPFVSYFALVVGLVSPALAAGMDRMLAARPPASGNVKPAVQRHLVSYGILEGAALMCAVALFLAADLLPLAAALVPVGTMVLRFPRPS
jgi:hypothetical protein